MKFRMSILAVLCLVAPLAIAQGSIAASTGLAPGNSFTLFVTFQDPMPQITSIDCHFILASVAKQGQENFPTALICKRSFKKIDDTNYSVEVGIPAGAAEGDYKLDAIGLTIGNAGRRYVGPDLPSLALVTIHNPEHLKFSPIKKLDVKP